LLKNAAKQRSIIEAARRVEQKASERFLDEEELTQLQDSFQQAAFQIAVADEERRGPEPISSLLGSLIHDLDARAERRNLPSGIRTGFTKLDHYTTGFQPGELVIVCGRPGHGKTAFALDVSLYVARHVPVVLFSLEMSANQIAQRLAAKLGRINLRTVRSATLSDTEFSRLVTAWGQSDDLQLYIDDSGIVSPAQVRSRARELAIRIGRPAGLIMVDYLQLMAPGRKYDNREREIASISREMKLTAKVLNCPVLMASQLNRELEKRADKRPIVSDLRESGAIEQDCDVCIGLYLPFNYSNQDEDRNEAEAILLKQRNGPIGTISLFWQSETTSFHDPI
jgi:replicative DNA helicase